VDRCALFVDAGYVLADGAMAVHGTRHRESASWDYAGLLSFMGSIARERTGRPLLRCYWYEASVEGRRTSEHDSLADLPGLKLRLGRTRPGRREGVESEIRRDLTTLARNNAISDALLVSAEEDLAQVVADVQDLGIRVTIVHITVGGNWTISRSLRQECDDIIEIGEGHLRPFTQLVAGTEPLGSDDELRFYVDVYERTGFTGGLNWYRALRKDFEEAQGSEYVVDIPALLVYASDDWFFFEASYDGLDAYLPQIEQHEIEVEVELMAIRPPTKDLMVVSIDFTPFTLWSLAVSSSRPFRRNRMGRETGSAPACRRRGTRRW